MAGLDGCGKLDITEISHDNIVVIGDKVWIKAEVEEKIWIYKNRPCTVIKFNDACFARMCNDKDPIPRGLLMAVDNAQILDCGPGADGEAAPNPSQPGVIDESNSRKAKTIRDGTVKPPKNKKDLETARTAVDLRSINSRGFQGTAVVPSVAVIPMRSNISVYGPYASSNFGSSCGGTQVEVNTDLAPWVFGSVAGMNAAGQSIVESTAIGLVKSETGGVTIPGLPNSQFDKLGAGLGNGGATLSSMNFSYGSGGITTSYEFKTYTPKFGGLNRHLIDRIKDVTRNRTEQLRFLRNQQGLINKIGRKAQVFNQRFKPNNKGPNDKPSLQRVFVGEMYNWQNGGQRSVIGIDTMDDSVGEMVYDFDKKAYMSWDLLLGPISRSGDGGLPRYASFDNKCHKASPDYPEPPFAVNKQSVNNLPFQFPNGLDQHNLSIDQKYLDPVTNNFEDQDHHHTGKGRGHVIDLIGGGVEVPQQGLITNFYHPDDPDRYDEDYRFLSMRGPILLHSWGYDTQGKPIPNESDIENDTKEGKFKKEELKDKFLTNWLGKPATWPVAPIDFRFDRKRGVWVTPPGYRVVVAELREKLNAYSTAEAQLINRDTTNNKEFGPELFDKDGQKVKATDQKDSEAVIKIIERLGQTYNSGTRVYCYYDTFSCEYIILNAKPEKNIRFRLIDVCLNTPAEPDYGDNWTKFAGYGDKFPNNHILGIRINCEGDTVNNKGNPVNHLDIAQAINDANNQDFKKAKEIFINLFDTCGTFGSAYAYFSNQGLEGFNEWKAKAATGFAIICDPEPRNTCLLGEQGVQCSQVNQEYDSYDIIFLDGYARFVECRLKQKLYMSTEEVESKHPQDEFKKLNPKGNSSATIIEFYGDAGNGVLPKFYKANQGGLEETDFRVFDPFFGEPEDKNPFIKLNENDKVLAVFDENRKKYIIYNSLKEEEKVIKFALVDNKNVSTTSALAVLVDFEGYPIDKFGKRLTEENFAEHFIVVYDTFAIHGYSEPTPKYHNFRTSGFGPALGSEDFNEHINGITLFGGDQAPPPLPGGNPSPVWKGGPFIGFAIHRPMGEEVSSPYKDFKYGNEIFFLESFAKTITGKICSLSAIVDNSYHLGALATNLGVGGYGEGRIPFTRKNIVEDKTKRANLRVGFPIPSHEAGRYITGDFFEAYIEKDVFNNVDGCKFCATLDYTKSDVVGGFEKLYYLITEVDSIANRGKTVLTKKEKSDELNKGEVKEKKDKAQGIISKYLDGFMWDSTNSQKKYEKTTIKNREDWIGKALIMKSVSEDKFYIRTSLADYNSNDGTITYRVDFAGTIAQVGEASLKMGESGKFGHVGGIPNKDDKKILDNNFSDMVFYHGLSPKDNNAGLGNNDVPIFEVNNNWMTYNGSKIIGLWDESTTDKIEDAKYRIVYAREAPVIITAVAAKAFFPETNEAEVIITAPPPSVFSSCPGADKEPVVTIIKKALNNMGYGAAAGDFVTLQRVYSVNIIDRANYTYLVIGTGKKPGTCSTS
jgi:hypothetical protein